MKLLLIEDNRVLAYSIKDLLSNDFIVDLAFTAEEGLSKAAIYPDAIVVLDLRLPDNTGRYVCQKLRESGHTGSILILTADARSDSCVDLLEMGADDYLTKPFNGAELKARLHALLRRQAHAYSTLFIRVDDLVIDISRRSVARGGSSITLRRKEFDILVYLARNRGRAVTRNMIFNHVWESGNEGWSNSVDVHIKYLRDKVDRKFTKPLIKTAYGIGYMVDDDS